MVKVRKDLTGLTFGKLTVLKQTEDHISSKGNHTARWICQCNCKDKTIIIVRQNNLTSGNTQTCGCGRVNRKGRPKFGARKQNKYDLSGEYGIGWTQKGEEFWFDKEDYDLIKDYSWHYSSRGYVETIERETRKRIFLHRLVMGDIPDKMIVDHKIHPKGNSNKYDNRKSNLEIKTPSQNNMNADVYVTSSTGVRGVTYDSKVNKWQARICINYKRIHLGWFDNIEDAIKAREEAEIKYYGEYSFKEINKEVI